MKTLFLGLLVLGVVTAVNAPLPKFCKGLDCPQFTVEKQLDEDTQIRNYSNQKWATITYELNSLSDYDDVSSNAFRQLFKYIDGQNQQGAKIPMASPVLNMLVPETNSSKITFTMGFFVPFEYQQNPIPANNENIQIQSLKGTFAVRSFGGRVINYPSGEFNDLQKTLKTNNIQFDENVDFVAGYDSPFTLFNRHNEVWYRISE